jgi:hypothetical protein
MQIQAPSVSSFGGAFESLVFGPGFFLFPVGQ